MAKKPKIRFNGFQDDWQEKKLSECLSISEDKNKDDKYGKEDVLSVSGEYGIVNQIEFQGRSFAGASVSNYRIVKDGNVVYTKSPLKANPYGIIKASEGTTGIVSPLYAVYRPKSDASAKFIEQYFDDDNKLNNYLRPLVNKGAKNTLLITDEGALQGLVYVPSPDEQKKIGEFLTTLDETILLRERELEKLKQLKAACLDKMFANGGANRDLQSASQDLQTNGNQSRSEKSQTE